MKQITLKTKLPFLASLILYKIKSAKLMDVIKEGRTIIFVIHYDLNERASVNEAYDAFYSGTMQLQKDYFDLVHDLLFLMTMLHMNNSPLKDWTDYRFKHRRLIEVTSDQNKAV